MTKPDMQCCAQCGWWTEAHSFVNKNAGVRGCSNRITFGTDICKRYEGDHTLPTNQGGRVLNVK